MMYRSVFYNIGLVLQKINLYGQVKDRKELLLRDKLCC